MTPSPVLDAAVDAVTETFPHLFDTKEQAHEVLGVAFDAVRKEAPRRVGELIAHTNIAFTSSNAQHRFADRSVNAVLGEVPKP
jgi:hypothetical protein